MSIPLKQYEGSQFAPVYASVATGGIVGGAVVQLIIVWLISPIVSLLHLFIFSSSVV